MTVTEQTGRPFGAGSVSLRLYPHNELAATTIVDHLCTMAAEAAECAHDEEGRAGRRAAGRAGRSGRSGTRRAA